MRFTSSIDMDCVAYSATSFGSSLMHQVFMFYYVKIFINYYHVSQWWFQISQVVFMIWNTVNDPLVGYFQDNSNWKCFKSRRLSVLYGAPFFAITFLIPWFPWAQYNPGDWICGLHLMCALNFYDAVFTFVLLAHCCLFAEMSSTYKNRLNMKWYSVIASLCASWAVPFVNYTSDNMTDMTRFRTACVILSVIGFLAMTYTGCNAHTSYEKDVAAGLRMPSDDDTNSAKSYQGSMLKLTLEILKDRDFLAFVFTNFFQLFHSVFLSNFTSIFMDNLVDISSKTKSLYFGLLFTLPSLSIIFGRSWILSLGYYRVIRWSCFYKIIASVCMYCTGLNTYVYLTYVLIDTVLVHATFSLYDLVLSDVADKDMRQHQRSHPVTSMIFGTNALVTKPSISISPMIIVAVLGVFGYGHIAVKNTSSSSLAAGRTPAVSTTEELRGVMFFLSCAVPFCVGLIQLFTWSCYKIRGSHEDSQKSALEKGQELLVVG